MAEQDIGSTVADTAVLEASERAGKYLTFKLGAEEYGLGILKVREIIGLMDITAVPRTPPHIRGVINLRGKVIPVVDLRRSALSWWTSVRSRWGSLLTRSRKCSTLTRLI